MCLAMVPRDGLFCKDGRGWNTSSAGRGHALDWPWPSTVLGAVRTAWGQRLEAGTGHPLTSEAWRERTASVRLGRSLALRRSPDAPWSPVHRMWPVPQDAILLEGRPDVLRLRPRPVQVRTLGSTDDPAVEHLWRPVVEDGAKELPRHGWWDEGQFTAWLAGQPLGVELGGLDIPRRVQVHVGIKAAESTADEGVLFSHDVLETLDCGAQWAIGIEVEAPEVPTLSVAGLGSDRRLVHLESLDPKMFAAPADLLDAFERGPGGLRLVSVTPSLFARGWLPDGLELAGETWRGRIGSLEDVVLRAALVSRPLDISGWDMVARRPKPSDRMVRQGSVYFIERADGRPFGRRDAEALWMVALGERTGEGFGRFVPGIWNPMEG